NPYAWVHTAGWTLLALALLALAGWWLRRRRGPRALWRVLAGLWIAAAVAACAAQGAPVLNGRGLAPQAEPAAVRGLGSRTVAPTARGPGGTLLVLQLPGGGPLQQVLVPPGVDVPSVGQGLALGWSRGRWWGRYATGWQDGQAPGAPRSSAHENHHPRPRRPAERAGRGLHRLCGRLAAAAGRA